MIGFCLLGFVELGGVGDWVWFVGCVELGGVGDWVWFVGCVDYCRFWC